jgi:putative transposase
MVEKRGSSSLVYRGAESVPFREIENSCYDHYLSKGDAMPRHRLLYHFAWSTKHRKPLMDVEIRKVLLKSIVAKAVELDSFVLALNGIEDHVHMLVAAPPAVAPSVLIGQIKGASSHLVRHSGWTNFQWQGEYGVNTVSERDVPKVVKYIRNQEERHKLNG